MITRSYIRRAAAKSLALMSLLCCVALSACNDLIYDDEGDCSYRVHFRYDYNMKYADAFAHEVSYVTLYVLDTDGNVVWQKTEEGDALARDGYSMVVDIDPGKYSLLAWCGTKDFGSFAVPQSTLATDLTCTLNRSRDAEGQAYVDTDVDRLFHGWLAETRYSDKDGIYSDTVPLIKDTNVFRIVLQHTSGDDVDVNKFTFTITDDNGSMDWDNSLLDDETLTYYAWHTDQGEAEIYTGMEMGDVRHSTFCAAVAELTTSRLVVGHNPRLTITNNETGALVLSIPLIDYALLVKGYYNQDMDDQEYLDRQDEYDMVFFLDEGDRWEDTEIYINSWHVVLQNKAL
ncbi:MAG: FimB/Mfa2 family fimbrial subunit [Prevotellaceae bacterium]|nr:FimB/Mfa2 family fimbrial subunit [Prevotellaceae bacterium]